MALPKWITPAGSLGTVPELEYYQLLLDAYDASGGALTYKLVSGRLPLGLQIISSGRLQGIPVSELGGDTNVEYRFTVRVQNAATGGLSDRTFSITVTNVAPPIIVPKNVDLGLFLDGSIVKIQLEAIEFTPGAQLSWSVVEGDLPTGLSLTPAGLISGYLEPISDSDAAPGWDLSDWNLYPWDFVRRAVRQVFSFTAEVFDGVNYDRSTYEMLVFPRSALTADNNTLTVDTTSIEATLSLSVNTGERHDPIIITTQDQIVPVRQGSFFAFDINAVDLDNDVLDYSLPTLASGAFDEQDFTSTISYDYIPTTPINDIIYGGVYPKVETLNIAATIKFYYGNVFSFTVGDYITQGVSGANARVIANVTNSSDVQVTITNSNFVSGKGNIAINGTEQIISSYNDTTATWANIGVYPESVTTGEPIITVDYNSVGLLPGAEIKVVDNNLWYNATVNQTAVVKAYGNTTVTGSAGQFLTQPLTGANATITSISPTIGTIALGGITRIGSIQIVGAIFTANVGDYITQPTSGANARVTADVVNNVFVPVVFTAGNFTINSGNVYVNSTNTGGVPSIVVVDNIPVTVNANVGDIVLQSTTGANAIVTANTVSSTKLTVQMVAGTFATNTGNISINGNNIDAYPATVSCITDITASYNNLDRFYLRSTDSGARLFINGVDTFSYPNSIAGVGVTVGSLANEGETGFDEGRFDQGTIKAPEGLTIDVNTGWISGQLSPQSVNEVNYEFEVLVNKRDYPSYRTSQLYSLTVLGDLTNRIDWITPADLGTIQNGKISDLSVAAVSSKGKTLIYKLAPGNAHRLPQGLILTSGGLLSGRVSFQIFGLDSGTTTIDGLQTTFDNTYTFTANASDLLGTLSADRTFTIRVIERNILPYENLYLKAMPSKAQRDYFNSILQDNRVFPRELIYRPEDPFFGTAKEIKTLFLPGLNPSTVEEYTIAAATNHFTKRITFGEVKTAQALDENFNVKYEIIYLDIKDENTNASGRYPASTINLSESLETPYYDLAGNPYTVAYPNAFGNMSTAIATALGYANKGALPDWMTSRQTNGRVLGFTRAVVLAYVVPGAGDLIAYRFNQQGYNLNSIDFTVDRYLLDNNYSDNYDAASGSFVTSSETTFDRYPNLSLLFSDQGVVNYASTTPFEEINNRTLSSIKDAGGIDGIKNIKNGDRIIFANQEFRRAQTDIQDYNQGWSNVLTNWDGDIWDDSNNTLTTSDDLGWDAAGYVPGYNENNLDPLVANERIGVWEISIVDGVVMLNFVKTMSFYDRIYVRNGFTYGGTNVYYDPVVKTGNNFPNYSIIPQEIRTEGYTSFDGNGTRFFDYRDTYTVPGVGDKYIKFTKTGVFN